MDEKTRTATPVADTILKIRARLLAAPAREVTLSTDELGWLIVRAGGGRYALRLDSLEGLVRLPRTVPLPNAPMSVAGLANIHGRAMTVIDLGALLGSPPSTSTAAVLMSLDGNTVALAVGNYEGVATYSEKAVQPPSPGLSRCVRGIGPTGVGVIDTIAVQESLRAVSVDTAGSKS